MKTTNVREVIRQRHIKMKSIDSTSSPQQPTHIHSFTFPPQTWKLTPRETTANVNSSLPASARLFKKKD